MNKKRSPENPMLSLRNIRKQYGSTEVLHGIDLDIYSGEVVALLGENGAGKSTLSGIIAGAIEPSSGIMQWRNKTYSPNSPRQAINAGVVLIHQELRLLPELTIAENIFVGRYPTKNGKVDRSKMNELATKQIKRLGLNIPASRKVEGLATASQQLIEIAKALTLNANLLILDEPTAALGVAETELLFQQIDRLKSEDVSIIYISHRLEEIRRVADRIVIMRDGQKVAEQNSSQVAIKKIVKDMVGRNLECIFPDIPIPTDEIILKVENLSSSKSTFHDVSFTVNRGEILGIAGLVGSGRTDLVRAITGADSIVFGQVYLYDQIITPKQPLDSIEKGIILVPEDRKLQGLVLEHSLTENIGYSNMQSIKKNGLINQRKLKQFAQQQIKHFGVKGQGNQNANELSGGNQQKVVLAKWLARNPQVVILDEPTRGIDVGARSSIYSIITDLAKNGVTIIVVSSDLEEILGLSHRVMVMAQGKCVDILDREAANDVSVMELALL
ncbi:MAG: sugar ABC transporter ATP-binding protein [Ostreibacterium sp.]